MDEKGLHAKDNHAAVLFTPLQGSMGEPHAQFSRKSQLRCIVKT